MIRDRLALCTVLLVTAVFALVSLGTLEEPASAVQTGTTAAAHKVSDLERLVAVEEIIQLKARYFRCMDMKDWACLEGLFTKDAVAEYGNGHTPGEPGAPPDRPPIKGGSAIAAFIRKGVEKLLTGHHGHMPEIEVTSATTARGIWPMEDLLRERLGDPPNNRMHGYGHYREQYERINGKWYIKHIVLTRLRVDRPGQQISQ